MPEVNEPFVSRTLLCNFREAVDPNKVACFRNQGTAEDDYDLVLPIMGWAEGTEGGEPHPVVFHNRRMVACCDIPGFVEIENKDDIEPEDEEATKGGDDIDELE